MLTNDKKIEMVRRFEENAEASGRRSLVKDAKKCAGELDLHLNLVHPGPTGATGDRNEEIEGKKIGVWVKRAQQGKNADELRAERWQGKLVVQIWEDGESGTECLAWMSEWRSAPTHIVAGMQELYLQLLPTKIYHHKKTGCHTLARI